MFDWMTGFIEAAGLAGIAFLMCLENVFPPIPSELIMPLAGFTAASGQTSLIAVILAGSAGSLAGAVFWYWIGRKIGDVRLKRWAARYGRWMTVSPQDIDASMVWFTRYGSRAVLLGRLIPTVRTFISVPAGLSRMPFGRFLVWSAIGTLLWTSALTLAGYLLQSQYTRVEAWLNPVSSAVVILVAGWYIWRVIRFRSGRDGM